MSDKNVLNISNPSQCHCAVKTYSDGHSNLWIMIRCGSEPLFYSFMDVRYFSGPMKWIDASFYVAPKSECFDMLKKIYPQESLDITRMSLKLYQVNLETTNVQIIAGNLFKRQDDGGLQVIETDY